MNSFWPEVSDISPDGFFCLFWQPDGDRPGKSRAQCLPRRFERASRCSGGGQWKPSCVGINHIYKLIVMDGFLHFSLFKPFCRGTLFCLIAFISLTDPRWYSLGSYSCGTHKVLQGLGKESTRERERESDREMERESMNDSERVRKSVANSPLESTHCFPSADGGFLSKRCQDYHERIW